MTISNAVGIANPDQRPSMAMIQRYEHIPTNVDGFSKMVTYPDGNRDENETTLMYIIFKLINFQINQWFGSTHMARALVEKSVSFE